MLYPCMFCVALSMDVCFLCCVFVNCLVKQFAIFLGGVVNLLLNVMEMLSVGGGWIDRVWSSKECMGCACDPSERLGAPSICFVCVFVCRKLSPHLGV